MGCPSFNVLLKSTHSPNCVLKESGNVVSIVQHLPGTHSAFVEHAAGGMQDIQEIIEELKGKAIVVEPNSRFLVIKEKEADNRILECAVEGKTQFIISGDKRHILPLKEFRGIKILNPEEFLRLVK